MKPQKSLALLCCLSSAALSLPAQTPAFPGAMGFGANVGGGRGGTVYHVTTLADSGPGSFRDAVSHSKRIIVFDVGGYIKLNSAVSCAGDLTIAGQTAPGGGIGFRGGEISFSSRSNVICRYIRIRPGSETASSTDDALAFADGRNMIFDHVSLEFGPWNNVGCVSSDWQNTPVTEVTFQNCLNANPTGQQFGAHTESVNSTMSWFYTLFANSHNRNPLSKINDTFINNVLYNCSAGYTTHTSTSFDHDIVNNYFISGPADGGSADFPWFQIDSNQSIYNSGNYDDGNLNGALDGSLSSIYWYSGTGTILGAPWSSLTSTSVLYSARAAYRVTISQAGAFPRDQIDDLVVSQVKTLGNGTAGTGAGTVGPGGSLYTSQTQTGLGNNGYGTINGGTLPLDSDGDGMPDYFEQANGFNLGSNDAMTIGGDGYARIEKYINWLADPHASTTTNVPVAVDLWQYTTGFTNDSPVYTVSGAVNGSVTISNSHYAVFTPTASFIGMGSYQFRVNSADGSAYTNTVSIAISALQPPSNLLWQGDGVANVWTNGGPANWLKDGNPVAFSVGDNVTFDDSGSSSPEIFLPASVSPGVMSFVASQDYTVSGGGAIIGGGSLYKVGQGTLTLKTLNTFTGGTVINEGIVQLGDGVSVNGSINGSVINNDTLIFANPTAVSSSAAISGSGELIKTGAGTLTLSGTQSFTNRTTILAGTLEFSGTPSGGDITNNGVLTFKPGSPTIYGGKISGPGSVTVNNSAATVYLTAASSFTGGFTNTAGNTVFSNNAAAGTGPVIYTAGSVMVAGNCLITNDFTVPSATTDLMMQGTNGTGIWAGNVVNLGSGAQFRPGADTGGALTFTGNALLGGRFFIVPRGSVSFASNCIITTTQTGCALGRDGSGGNRSANVTIRDNASLTLGGCNFGGGNAGGNVTVTIQNNGALNLGTASLDLNNVNRTTAQTFLRLNGGTLTVGGFTKTKTSQTNVIQFNGGVVKAGAANAAFLPVMSVSSNWVQAGGAKIDDGGFNSVAIGAPLLHDPALGATADGGLAKLGIGNLILAANNTYTGPTLITAGILSLYAPPLGSISNSGSIYIAGGAALSFSSGGTGAMTLGGGKTIWGSGSVSGNFTLASAAILAPGSNAIGTLTFSNSLALASGCTNLFEISHAPLTNDMAKVLGALTNGGTLIVSNLSGTLAAGESFKLFDAMSYSGSFSTVILPPLNAGLAWNTNQLNTAGSISVISAAPLAFSAAAVSGGDLILSGSNGPALGNYYVLTSTNVGTPLANWLRLVTNQFDANGGFRFTNVVNPLTPQLFHRLQLP